MQQACTRGSLPPPSTSRMHAHLQVPRQPPTAYQLARSQVTAMDVYFLIHFSFLPCEFHVHACTARWCVQSLNRSVCVCAMKSLLRCHGRSCMQGTNCKWQYACMHPSTCLLKSMGWLQQHTRIAATCTHPVLSHHHHVICCKVYADSGVGFSGLNAQRTISRAHAAERTVLEQVQSGCCMPPAVQQQIEFCCEQRCTLQAVPGRLHSYAKPATLPFQHSNHGIIYSTFQRLLI